MNGTDFWDDGNDEKECQHIARYLESLGVASLNVSSGSYESGWSIIEPYPYQEGWKKHLVLLWHVLWKEQDPFYWKSRLLYVRVILECHVELRQVLILIV